MKYMLLLILSIGSFFITSAYADQTATPNPSLKTRVAHAEKISAAKINKTLDEITPSQDSVLEKKYAELHSATQNPLSIALFRPTYILPFYYTASPYAAVYQGNTPNEQKIMNAEFKAQMSFFVPVMQNVFNNPNTSLDIAYTQLNYWQIYAASQYFRETNYEPEIFIEDHFHRNWLMRLGLDHQSNGRGGELERSWNRATTTVEFSGEDWIIGLKAWALIFQKESSAIHNPDIAHYLGYENLLFSYKIKKATVSFEVQNLESLLRRGHIQATLSYPIWQHMSLYTQYFSGYGQSLIEYNHRTQSVGIGIAFNDWI